MDSYEKTEVKRLAEIERRRRRLQRITQVRQQTNTWLANSREKFGHVKSLQLKELISEVTADVTNEAIQNLEILSRRHDDAMSEIGAAHRAAANYPDYQKIKELKQVENDKKAQIRYSEAIKKAKGDQHELEEKRHRLQRIRDIIRSEEDFKSKSLVERRPFHPKNVEVKPETVRAKLKREGYQQSLAKSLYVPGTGNKSPHGVSEAHGKFKIKKRQRRAFYHKKEKSIPKKKEGLFSVVAAAREAGTSIEPMQRYVKQHSPQANDQKMKSQRSPKSPDDVIYVNANIPLPPQKYKPPVGLVVKIPVDPEVPSAWDKAKVANHQQEEEDRKARAAKRVTEKKRKERGAKAIKIARLHQRYNKLATELMTIDEVEEEHGESPPPQIKPEFSSRVKEQYDQLLAASANQLKSLMGDEDKMELEGTQPLFPPSTSTKAKESTSRPIPVSPDPAQLPSNAKQSQRLHPPFVVLRGLQKKSPKISIPSAADPAALATSTEIEDRSKLTISTTDPKSPGAIPSLPITAEVREDINAMTSLQQNEMEKQSHRDDYLKLKGHLLALEEELKRRNEGEGNKSKDNGDKGQTSSGTVSMSDIFTLSPITSPNHIQQEQPEVVILQGAQKVSTSGKTQVRKAKVHQPIKSPITNTEASGKENVDPIVLLKGPTLKVSTNQEQSNLSRTSKGAQTTVLQGPTRVNVKKSKNTILANQEQSNVSGTSKRAGAIVITGPTRVSVKKSKNKILGQRKQSKISIQATAVQSNKENEPKFQKTSSNVEESVLNRRVSSKEGPRKISAEIAERTIRHYIGKLLYMGAESVSALKMSKSISSVESTSSGVQLNSSAVSTITSKSSEESTSFRRRPLRPQNNQSPYTNLIDGSQHSRLLLPPQETSTPLSMLGDRKSEGGRNDSPLSTSTLSSNFPEVNVNVIYDTSDTLGSTVEHIPSDHDLHDLLAGLCLRQAHCLTYSPPKESRTPDMDPPPSPNDPMSTLGPRLERLLRLGQRKSSQESSDDQIRQRPTNITNRTETPSTETRRGNGSSADEFQLSNSPLGISEQHRVPIPPMIGRVTHEWEHITIERPTWLDADSSLDKEN